MKFYYPYMPNLKIFRSIFFMLFISFVLFFLPLLACNNGEPYPPERYSSNPTCAITSPSNDSTYNEGDNITFSCTGEDAEDGTLTGSSLVWRSSIDGQIGTGTSFTSSILSAKTHTITLTATDSDGMIGTASISIVIKICPPPENVSATAGDAQVTISWDSVDCATSYNIYWSTSSGVTKDTGTKISDVTSPYPHTGCYVSI